MGREGWGWAGAEDWGGSCNNGCARLNLQRAAVSPVAVALRGAAQPATYPTMDFFSHDRRKYRPETIDPRAVSVVTARAFLSGPRVFFIEMA